MENSQKNNGGAAFPCFINNGNWEDNYYEAGMSLRDYFAAKAMTGEISIYGMEGCDAKAIAAMAYELADAMIAERQKGKPQ